MRPVGALYMKLVLATNNLHKIEEIRHALADLPVKILSRSDFHAFPDPDETADTLEENAIIKARAVRLATGSPSLADDTGLEVSALGGAPGALSARYAGPNATYTDNVTKLLKALTGVPFVDPAAGQGARSARFRTVIAIDWGDTVETVEGVINGHISDYARGDKGFGYDPVFVPDGHNQTFAEMSLDEKNTISHRGQALALAREVILTRLRNRTVR